MSANNTDVSQTYCRCGGSPDGIDARTQQPSCRRCAGESSILIPDGGRDLTDDPVDVDLGLGIRHDLNELPDDFGDLSYQSQRAIAGGFGRSDLIDLIRQAINSETTTKTDRLAKPELVDVLISLYVGNRP